MVLPLPEPDELAAPALADIPKVGQDSPCQPLACTHLPGPRQPRLLHSSTPRAFHKQGKNPPGKQNKTPNKQTTQLPSPQPATELVKSPKPRITAGWLQFIDINSSTNAGAFERNHVVNDIVSKITCSCTGCVPGSQCVMYVSMVWWFWWHGLKLKSLLPVTLSSILEKTLKDNNAYSLNTKESKK